MRQSLFEDDNKLESIEDLKLKCKIIPLKYEDIVFSPLSQLMCQNCGMFGRTFRCPPFTMKYDKTREYLKQFNKFVLIISESDENEMKERYRHEIEDFKVGTWKAEFYMGTQANAINLRKVRNDMRSVLRFAKTRYEKVVAYDVGGGCLKCRKCNKHQHKPCKYPLDSFPSPEGSGIDVYSTLKNVSYTNFDTPPVWKYISLAMVCYKE